MPLLEILLVLGVLLTIVDLIVRDQTQFRLVRLRGELLGLRSEEKRLSERRKEVELMVAQIGDALMRTERRRHSIEKGGTAVGEALDKLDHMARGDGGDGEDNGAEMAK